ncbi:unnamed protein product [Strongylus vulgaris]|uniref:LRRCT domain-containing protein n=1 Tax=Strongylus vulgaris TaxID=40348 RepID=A0A3P7JID4_STRVU|nr:unnamed protein product [Strongylus vulgaris]
MLRRVRTLFLVLLISFTSISFVAAQCPAISGPCRCAPSIYEPVAIICENAGSLSNALQAIQPARDISIDSLTILDTAIPSIPANAFAELSLETNALTSIPSAALVNQRGTLTNLNLGLNNINEVPVGALDFPNLTSLSLEFNGITVIPPQAFQGVPNLQYLYLTGNKFPSWAPEMFRYITQLRTLGIGETPISVIPNNAFMHIPHLIRLEMSEAAIDTIERGAFQRTPQIQAIVLNKNRLSQIRADFFEGLNDLYSIDVQGNRIENVQPLGFANLPSLTHLDISYNQLQTLPENVFMNSFLPRPNDRRVIYCCGNPWFCNNDLLWFRQLLRDNLDIDIEKPGCLAVCAASPSGCPAEGTPLRAVDFCLENEEPQPLTGTALSLVGWIILAIIMTILLISICLLAMVRYGMSHRRKKQKDQELEDDARMMSSAGERDELLFLDTVMIGCDACTHLCITNRPKKT